MGFSEFMVRRISASQLRNKIRQAKQKQRQALNKYNQAVRQNKQKMRTAVNKHNSVVNDYNRKVRAHNVRVRANRTRLSRLISQLNSQKTVTTKYVVYRTSVESLHDTFRRFENQLDSNQIGPEYNRFVDLAERETANSVDVANRLFGNSLNTTDDGIDNLQNADLGDKLRKISPDLDDRWQGAVFSLNPKNPDAARHFCTSARELFTQILEITASDTDVFAALPSADKTDRGNATRRSKIKFLLHRQGMLEETLENFVETNIENVVQLFRVFNDGTHGSVGTFGLSQLTAIKKRVEDGITFLTEIIGIV